MPKQSDDKNSLSKRAKRYAKVSTEATKIGFQFGLGALLKNSSKTNNAILIKSALGGLKGPLMKIAQLASSIPDLLPDEYVKELSTLQSEAPSMGWSFVRRRMSSELGKNWQSKFENFDKQASFSASLGQVHKASTIDGKKVACKLQYPDMSSVVDADLYQLKIFFNLFENFDGSVQTKKAYEELSLRLNEELDYKNEANNMKIYGKILHNISYVHVPKTFDDLSTDRLLTMSWLEGEKMLDAIKNRNQEDRNIIAKNMFQLWYLPLYKYGILHGDPHLGNYTVRKDNSINLLDYGCVRIFNPNIVKAMVDIYDALKEKDEEKLVYCYKLWGFKDISNEVVEILSRWAEFVYAPVLDDRARFMSDTNTTIYGKEIASKIHSDLKKVGGVELPAEFVLIDRASIGLGGLFIRLNAKVNWHNIFHDLTHDFDINKLKERQNNLFTNDYKYLHNNQ